MQEQYTQPGAAEFKAPSETEDTNGEQKNPEQLEQESSQAQSLGKPEEIEATPASAEAAEKELPETQVTSSEKKPEQPEEQA